MPNKKISYRNIPSKPPIWNTLVCFLVMERFNAPEWLWGVLGFIFAIAWVASIYGIIMEEAVDIFEEKPKKENNGKA